MSAERGGSVFTKVGDWASDLWIGVTDWFGEAKTTVVNQYNKVKNQTFNTITQGVSFIKQQGAKGVQYLQAEAQKAKKAADNLVQWASNKANAVGNVLSDYCENRWNAFFIRGKETLALDQALAFLLV